ncbi:Gluconate 2-dehydrogenase, membrane-bound, cytochrome c [Pantoea sp. AS-PWVM4]|uniref:c-type cytochrome n=1 Tax=Pantoea sp. AS-PWVM4 TaxID=1332069 RepID=UPI0003AC7888|nr:cytochrome c [Pantoea sp. AS-PWVM4]ERK16236.1 Gluconate 2-dehydrogenase, membrane-bound, cytochrome c [Pantoea sp. AS-PWVM4]
MKLQLRYLLMAGLVSTAAQAADNQDAALIAKGEYLARAGDCTACHSIAGGKEFGGGLAIASPMGVIYSTNISPDPEAGIGKYTEQEFADAVRKGIRRDGKHLYPAMPYPDYRGITDEDIHALYVYFMKGVKPVAEKAPETSLMFPFSQRWGMWFWNVAFTEDKPFAPRHSVPDDINRGKYLVETLGHCGSCHTPRGIGMQEKALNESSDKYLAGGELNGWPVPALRGMPTWSIQNITDYLATGRNDFASVGGEMTGVVEHSMQHMNDQDLHAIAAYLKSLPADTPVINRRADAEQETKKTADYLTQGHNLNAGQMLYMNNCEACHWTDGNGAKGIFPRLNGGDVVVADNPTGLINIILQGAQTPSTPKAPSVMAMPGFASRLSDEQVAQLATFVRSGWSNNAPAVTPKEVTKVRESLAKP